MGLVFVLKEGRRERRGGGTWFIMCGEKGRGWIYVARTGGGGGGERIYTTGKVGLLPGKKTDSRGVGRGGEGDVVARVGREGALLLHAKERRLYVRSWKRKDSHRGTGSEEGQTGPLFAPRRPGTEKGPLPFGSKGESDLSPGKNGLSVEARGKTSGRPP